MIAYFRIRKVLKSLQDFIVSEHFQCKTEDANSCVFRASRLYVCVKVSTEQEKLILEGDPSHLTNQLTSHLLRKLFNCYATIRITP